MARKISPEQLAQMKEFVQTFPEEEQEAKMQELLEELEQSEGAQKPQCPFCLMSSGAITTFKVFEDNEMLAVLEINPANPGHILLFPKAHVTYLKETKPEVAETVLRMAYTLSNILLTFAEGTNILFSEGAVAGQRFPHAVVHIIPRLKGDNVRIEWQSKPLGEKELGALREKIIGAIAQLTGEKKEKKVDASGLKESVVKQRKRRP